ncbi:hypothetical protein PSEUBRA_003812 [Kalmanozyma brasiliensis GHG001]|uniref:uncharacterized protein n=1 Tax=Kalmanozyma brasiliensis (strain GHG001) TaxID=1365824 RepID=UPI001CEA7BB5|nr:uncharacterized protein PSEUBRA_003812 [Kalmanozyma brasiliensis GHG001]KAF6767296.1 hypothetical protein PSEUBRA_003812 [Kalmanozyma brasiliensis GHG001]
MKLNAFFVALAIASSVSIHAAPLIEPRGFKDAWKAVKSASGKMLGKDSAYEQRMSEPFYSPDYVPQPGYEQYGNHAQTPEGFMNKKLQEKKASKNKGSVEGSSSTAYEAPPSHSYEASPEHAPSRESSPEPMSPPRAQQSTPGGAMVPYVPPPAPAPERPYHPFEYTGPNHPYAPAPAEYSHYGQPYHPPPGYAPQYGHSPSYPSYDLTPGYTYRPGHAHPDMAYSQYGNNYHYMHGAPGEHVPPPDQTYHGYPGGGW